MEQQSQDPSHATSLHVVSTISPARPSNLILFDVRVNGIPTPLRALLDTGASNNFIRSGALSATPLRTLLLTPTTSTITVRLANGSVITVPKRSVSLTLSSDMFKGKSNFILLDLDEKFDIILGMPWLKQFQPVIDWDAQTISVGSIRQPTAATVLSQDQFYWIQEISSPGLSFTPSEALACDGPTAHSEVGDPHSRIVNESVQPTSFASPNRFAAIASVDDGDTTADDAYSSGLTLSPLSRESAGTSDTSVNRQERAKTVRSPNLRQRSASVPDQDRRMDFSSAIDHGTGPTTESINTLVFDGEALGSCRVELENPPIEASALLDLPQMAYKTFLNNLKRGEIEQVCIILSDTDCTIATTSTMDDGVLGTKQERFESQTWDSLKSNPLYQDCREYADIFLDQPPSELPKDRGFRHEIELTPGTGYCFTRQWPLPRNQVEAIDDFFDRKYPTQPITAFLTNLLCKERHRRMAHSTRV